MGKKNNKKRKQQKIKKKIKNDLKYLKINSRGEEVRNLDYMCDHFKRKHAELAQAYLNPKVLSSVTDDKTPIAQKIEADRNYFINIGKRVVRQNKQVNKISKGIRVNWNTELASLGFESEYKHWRESFLYTTRHGKIDTSWDSVKPFGPYEPEMGISLTDVKEFNMPSMVNNILDCPRFYSENEWPHLRNILKQHGRSDVEIIFRSNMQNSGVDLVKFYLSIFFDMDIINTDAGFSVREVEDYRKTNRQDLKNYITAIHRGDVEYVKENFHYKLLQENLTVSTNVLSEIWRNLELEMFGIVFEKIAKKSIDIAGLVLENFPDLNTYQMDKDELSSYFTSLHFSRFQKLNEDSKCEKYGFLLDIPVELDLMWNKEGSAEIDVLKQLYRVMKTSIREKGGITLCEYIYAEEFREFWTWYKDNPTLDPDCEFAAMILNNLHDCVYGPAEIYNECCLLHRIYDTYMKRASRDYVVHGDAKFRNLEKCMNFLLKFVPAFFEYQSTRVYTYEETSGNKISQSCSRPYATRLFDINALINLRDRYFHVMGISTAKHLDQILSVLVKVSNETNEQGKETFGKETFGKETYANGNAYEGEFQDGKKHGQGKKTWAGGGTYEGEWKDGKQHGQGKYTGANGNAYEGQWKDDKKHGKGKYTGANGDTYYGYWKDDAPYQYGRSGLGGLPMIEHLDYVSNQLQIMCKIEVSFADESIMFIQGKRLTRTHTCSSLLDIILRDGFIYESLLWQMRKKNLPLNEASQLYLKELQNANVIFRHAVHALGGNTNYTVAHTTDSGSISAPSVCFPLTRRVINMSNRCTEIETKNMENVYNSLHHAKTFVKVGLCSSRDDICSEGIHIIDSLRKGSIKLKKDCIQKGKFIEYFFEDYVALSEVPIMLTDWDVNNNLGDQSRIESSYRAQALYYMNHVIKHRPTSMFVNQILSNTVMAQRIRDEKVLPENFSGLSNELNDPKGSSVRYSSFELSVFCLDAKGDRLMCISDESFKEARRNGTIRFPQTEKPVAGMKMVVLMNKSVKQKFDNMCALLSAATDFSFLDVKCNVHGVSSNTFVPKGGFVFKEGDNDDVVTGSLRSAKSLLVLRDGKEKWKNTMLPELYFFNEEIISESEGFEWLKFEGLFKKGGRYYDIRQAQCDYGLMEIPPWDIEQQLDRKNVQVINSLKGKKWEVRREYDRYLKRIWPHYVISRIGSRIRKNTKTPNVRPWFVVDNDSEGRCKGWIFWEALKPILPGEELTWKREFVDHRNTMVEKKGVMEHAILYFLNSIKHHGCLKIDSIWDLHTLPHHGTTTDYMVQRSNDDGKILSVLLNLGDDMVTINDKSETFQNEKAMESITELFAIYKNMFDPTSKEYVFKDLDKKENFTSDLSYDLFGQEGAVDIVSCSILEAGIKLHEEIQKPLFNIVGFPTALNHLKDFTTNCSKLCIKSTIESMQCSNSLSSGWEQIIYRTKKMLEATYFDNASACVREDKDALTSNGFDAFAVQNDIYNPHVPKFYKSYMGLNFDWGGFRQGLGEVLWCPFSDYNVIHTGGYLYARDRFTLSNFAMFVIRELAEMQDEGTMVGYNLLMAIRLYVFYFYLDVDDRVNWHTAQPSPKHLNTLLSQYPFSFVDYVMSKHCTRYYFTMEKRDSYIDWSLNEDNLHRLFELTDSEIYFNISIKYQVETFLMKYIHYLSISDNKSMTTKKGNEINWECMQSRLHSILFYESNGSASSCYKIDPLKETIHTLVNNNTINTININSSLTRMNEIMINVVTPSNLHEYIGTTNEYYEMYKYLVNHLDSLDVDIRTGLTPSLINETTRAMLTNINNPHKKMLMTMKRNIMDLDNILNCGFLLELPSLTRSQHANNFLKDFNVYNTIGLETSFQKYMNEVVTTQWLDGANDMQNKDIADFVKNDRVDLGRKYISKSIDISSPSVKKKAVLLFRSLESPIKSFCGKFIMPNKKTSPKKKKDRKERIAPIIDGVGQIVFNNNSQLWGVFNYDKLYHVYKVNGFYLGKYDVEGSNDGLRNVWIGNAEFVSEGPKLKIKNGVLIYGKKITDKDLPRNNWFNNGQFPFNPTKNIINRSQQLNHMTRSLQCFDLHQNVSDNTTMEAVYRDCESFIYHISGDYMVRTRSFSRDIAAGLFSDMYIGGFKNNKFESTDASLYISKGLMQAENETSAIYLFLNNNFGLNRCNRCDGESPYPHINKLWYTCHRFFEWRLVGGFKNGAPHGDVAIELMSGEAIIKGITTFGTLSPKFTITFKDRRQYEVTMKTGAKWQLLSDDGTRPFYTLSKIGIKSMRQILRAKDVCMIDRVNFSEVLEELKKVNTVQCLDSDDDEFVRPISIIKELDRMNIKPEQIQIDELKSIEKKTEKKEVVDLDKPKNGRIKAPSTTKHKQEKRVIKKSEHFLSEHKEAQKKKKKKQNNNVLKVSSPTKKAQQGPRFKNKTTKMKRKGNRVGIEIQRRMREIENQHDKYCTAAQAVQQRSIEEKNLERMRMNNNRRVYMLRSLEIFAKLSMLNKDKSCQRGWFDKLGMKNQKLIYAYINVHKEGDGRNMTKAELLETLMDEYIEHTDTSFVYINVGRSNLLTDNNLRTYLFDVLANPDKEEGRGIVLSASTVMPSHKISSKYNSKFCEILLKVIFDRCSF